MLTYMTYEIENNPYRGGIEITLTGTAESLGTVTGINVTRRNKKKAGWNDVFSKVVSSVNDLTFQLFDMTSLSGQTYAYTFNVMAGDRILESETTDYVDCWFNGLFVGNSERQFVAGSNFKTEVKRNTQVAYITTLSGRVPYRVSNANTNYTTGSSSGLFLEVTEDKKKFIPDYDHAYSDSVVDFLSDGTGKVLKTHDGQIWYISVDDSISTPNNEGYLGMNSVAFSWTEIGDVPAFGMVENEVDG